MTDFYLFGELSIILMGLCGVFGFMLGRVSKLKETWCPVPWMRCFSITSVDCSKCTIYVDYNSLNGSKKNV